MSAENSQGGVFVGSRARAGLGGGRPARVIAGDPMRGSWVVGTMTGEGVRRSSMSWHHATGRHVVKWLQRLDVGGRIRCFVRPLVLAGSGAGDGVHGVLATAWGAGDWRVGAPNLDLK